MQWIEAGDGAVAGVVLDASSDLFSETVTDLDVGGKHNALVHAGTVKRAVERGIEAQVPGTEFAVYDGADFPGPGVGGEGGALISNFVGNADADRQVPGFWNSDTRANVVADPVPSAVG